MDLSFLKSRLSEDAQAVINEIWNYDLEKEKCIPTTALAVRLGQARVNSALKSLSGSVVIEHSGDGVKRCCLTFLGRLMTQDGERGKELLKRLLEFIKTNLLADPEFETVDSESVIRALSLTDGEFHLMSHHFWMSPFTGGGGGQKSRWSFSVPYYQARTRQEKKSYPRQCVDCSSPAYSSSFSQAFINAVVNLPQVPAYAEVCQS